MSKKKNNTEVEATEVEQEVVVDDKDIDVPTIEEISQVDEVSPIEETVIEEISSVEEISPIADVIAVIEKLIAPKGEDDGMADDDVVTYRQNSGKLAHGIKKGIIKLGYVPIEKYKR
jgi:hypothetical protein